MKSRIIVRREQPDNNVILFFIDEEYCKGKIACFSWLEEHSGASPVYMKKPYTCRISTEDQKKYFNRYLAQYCQGDRGQYTLVIQEAKKPKQ